MKSEWLLHVHMLLIVLLVLLQHSLTVNRSVVSKQQTKQLKRTSIAINKLV